MTREELIRYIDKYRKKKQEGDTVWLDKQAELLKKSDALLADLMSTASKALKKVDAILDRCGALN